MTHFSRIIFSFMIVLSFAVPSTFAAVGDGAGIQLVPCGRHSNNPKTAVDETQPCSMCHFIVLGHHIVTYGLYISVFLALAVITFGGITYIVSSGNEGVITFAKNMFKYALWGMVIVLIAWVLINTLITKTMPVNQGHEGLQGGWFQYTCGNGEIGGGGSGITNPPNNNNGITNPQDNTGTGITNPND